MIEKMIPWILTSISITIALVTVIHNYHKEDKADEFQTKESLIKANSKLDILCNNLNEVRIDNKSILNRVESIEKTQALQERDIKTLFRLHDELKGVKKDV